MTVKVFNLILHFNPSNVMSKVIEGEDFVSYTVSHH